MALLSRPFFQLYGRRGVWLLLPLGFSAGLPLVLVYGTLSLWLAEAGYDKGQITLLSWALLAYSFKFLWAPFIDRCSPGRWAQRLGRRRAWLLLSQLAIATALVLLALFDPVDHFSACVLGALLLAFSSATQDIVIDAYRIDLNRADAAQLSASAGTYSVGYRLGMMAAGAGALYLAESFGSTAQHYDFSAWRLTYLCMALLALLGPLTTLLAAPVLPDRDEGPTPDGTALGLLLLAAGGFLLIYNGFPRLHPAGSASWLRLPLSLLVAGGLLAGGLKYWGRRAEFERLWLAPLRDFCQRYRRQALWLLLLIGGYRLSDNLLGTVSQLFYADLGFSKIQIADANKIFGLAMTLAGGLVGGWLVERWRLWPMLWWTALGTAASNLLFILLHWLPTRLVLYGVISVDNLIGGIANSVFLAFLGALTNVRFTAVQYALFSSLTTLLPKLLAGQSGAMVEWLGYDAFFFLSFLLGLPLLLLIKVAEKKL